MPSSDDAFHTWKVGAIDHIISIFRRQNPSSEKSLDETKDTSMKRFRRVESFSLVDIEIDIVRSHILLLYIDILTFDFRIVSSLCMVPFTSSMKVVTVMKTPSLCVYQVFRPFPD